MTATPSWDETLHTRISDGTFTEKGQSAPELSIQAFDADDPDERPYNPSFRVPVNHLDLAVKRIDQANAKLARLGIEDRFTYETELTTEVRDGHRYEFAYVTLNRPSIGFDGWTFTGAHEFTPAGEVMNFWTTKDAPKVADNHCDHCGSKRARNKVFTVVHPEKGTMQIGASCLEAFLGMKPKGLWALDSDLELGDMERLTDGVFDVRSRVYDPEELLVATLVASNDGKDFISASKASYLDTPTAVVVSRDWEKLMSEGGDSKPRQVLARKILRWARKIEAEPGTYDDNLRAIFAGKKEDVYVRSRNLGLAVSVVSAYDRAMGRAAVAEVARVQKTEEKREFLAAPKEKVENLTATVQLVSRGHSYHGYTEQDTTFLVMVTDTGHVLTWNASSYQDLKTGDKVAISKATVKGNEMYRDTFQTNLTRAKLEKLDS